MRVEAGPDVARARRHVSTRRPDISGTHPYDLSLLRHRVCCREQQNGTDSNNTFSHRLSSVCFDELRAIAKGGRSVLGMLVDWSAVVWSAKSGFSTYSDRAIRTATTACCHTRSRVAGNCDSTADTHIRMTADMSRIHSGWTRIHTTAGMSHIRSRSFRSTHAGARADALCGSRPQRSLQ